ncbi:hypothetical protein R5R35_007247 [Gryllus longicercus]|uniref:Ig-like domain-containing protein n=1 Tax=Gryllus longicercus TaxID=2509291 RepID=A0AAN9WBS3_9ORTH
MLRGGLDAVFFWAALWSFAHVAASKSGVASSAGRSGGGGALRVAELRVPASVQLREGARAELQCRWELPAGAALYSAKWYKDGQEFLRFMPDERPPLLSFPVAGVRLQAGSYSAEAVTLHSLTVASGGVYRCEVSTEGPAFRTAYAQQRLSIIAPPPTEPRVMGVREAYAVGEVVSANCTAGRSHPPPHLTWYINGIKAERWFPGRAPAPLDEADAVGLVARTLPLRLRAERRLFQGPDRRLRLLCEANAAGLRWTRLLTPALLPDGSDGEDAAVAGPGPGSGGHRAPPRETEPLAREATRARPHDLPAHARAAGCGGPSAVAATLLLPSVLAVAS